MVSKGRQDRKSNEVSTKKKEMSSIKVMLVDDHQLLIDGFISTLSEYGVEVVSTSLSTDHVVNIYKRVKPDVLVLDLAFPNDGVNGLDICAQIIEIHHDAKVIILSQFDQDHVIIRSYKVGALAFVEKDGNIPTLVDAITSAYEGREYYSPHIAQRLARLNTSDDNPIKTLDEQELKVFGLIADGRNHVEIAEALEVSLKTIGRITQNIKSKLNIERQAEFTKLGIKYGIITFDLSQKKS